MDQLVLSRILLMGSCFAYHLIVLQYPAKLLLQQSRVRTVLVLLCSTVSTCLFAISKAQGVNFAVQCTFSVALSFAELLLIYRGNTLTLLWNAICFCFHLLCFRSIVASLLALFQRITLYDAMEPAVNGNWTLIIAMLLIVFYIQLFSFCWTDEKIRQLLSCPSQIGLVCIAEATMLAYRLLCAYATHADVPYTWFTLFHLFGAVIFLFTYYLILDSAVKFSLWIEQEFRGNLLKQQLQSQMTHYQAYQTYVEDFRAFREQYNYTAGGARACIQRGDLAGAAVLLNQADRRAQVFIGSRQSFSNHMVVDALLQDLALDCAQKGILFEANVFVPVWLGFSDLDLCRVFSNICNNAVEACEKIPEAAARRFTLTCWITEGWLTLCAENTFQGGINLREGKLVSSKRNSELHGIGISNVKNIVEAHGGFMSIEIDTATSLFKLTIHVSNPENIPKTT